MYRRIAVAMICAFTGVVFATTGFAAQKPDFSKADKNGDDKVSIQEAVKSGVKKKEAKKEDIDGDGKLTKTDWKYVEMEKESSSESSSGSFEE